MVQRNPTLLERSTGRLQGDTMGMFGMEKNKELFSIRNGSLNTEWYGMREALKALGFAMWRECYGLLF